MEKKKRYCVHIFPGDVERIKAMYGKRGISFASVTALIIHEWMNAAEAAARKKADKTTAEIIQGLDLNLERQAL